MRTNQAGLALIKDFEGLRLTAYQDPGGIWTIGWGSTRNVGPRQTITERDAEQLLVADISTTETVLNSCLELTAPKDPLNDNQYSALVSFCFNVGFGIKGVKDGFHTLKNGAPSTLLACVLRGDYADAAAEFPKWNKIGGVVSPGLVRRRAAEQALFLEDDPWTRSSLT